MAALSISRAWDETKARIGADGRLFATVAAALLLLPQAVIAVVAPPAELSGVQPPGWVNLLALVAGLIGIIGQIAIIRLALVSATSVGEAISHGARRFLPVFGAILILMCAVFIALVPLMLLFGALGAVTGEGGDAPRSVAIAVALVLVAAIFIGARFLMMMPVATAETGGPLHIIKRSWSLAGGSYFRLLAFMLLIAIAALVIVIAVQFVVGSLLSVVFGDIPPLSFGALVYALLFGAAQAAFAVVISVMLARMYVQLSSEEALDVTVPKTGT